jgi:hypothetical protein
MSAFLLQKKKKEIIGILFVNISVKNFQKVLTPYLLHGAESFLRS